MMQDRKRVFRRSFGCGLLLAILLAGLNPSIGIADETGGNSQEVESDPDRAAREAGDSIFQVIVTANSSARRGTTVRFTRLGVAVPTDETGSTLILVQDLLRIGNGPNFSIGRIDRIEIHDPRSEMGDMMPLEVVKENIGANTAVLRAKFAIETAKLLQDVPEPGTPAFVVGQSEAGAEMIQQSSFTVPEDSQHSFFVRCRHVAANAGSVSYVLDSNGRLAGIKAPLADRRNAARTSLFMPVCDLAAELRGCGVRMSDRSLTLSHQRNVQRNDRFGRPVRSGNLNVTWSDDHSELLALSSKTGRWTSLKIEAQDLIIPIVGSDVAAVRLATGIAGYSAETGTWDLLEIENVADASLRIESDAVYVEVPDSSRFYVLPVRSGRWNSPNDPAYRHTEVSLRIPTELAGNVLESNTHGVNWQSANGVVTVSGAKKRVDKIVSQLRLLSDSVETNSAQASPGLPYSDPASLTKLNSGAAISMALKLRSFRSAPSAEQRQALERLVRQELEQRLDQQRVAAEQLEARLNTIRKALKSRQDNRDRIVERRVEELLDPAIDWGNTSRNEASFIPAAIEGAQIGLPGPPHIPLGRPSESANKRPSVTSGASTAAGMRYPDDAVSRVMDARGKFVSSATNLEKAKVQLSEWEKPLEEIDVHRFSGGFRGEGERAERAELARRSIEKNKAMLRSAHAGWQHAWRLLQVEFANRKFYIDEAESKVQLAKLKLQQAKQVRVGRSSRERDINVQAAEIEMELVRIALERAQLARSAIADADQQAAWNPDSPTIKALLEPQSVPDSTTKR